MIVTGKILDSRGVRLPMVNISLPNQKGTTTNFDGEFMFNSLENDTVNITFMGMKPLTFLAKNVPPTITMQDSVNQLDEVVITAKRKKPFFATIGFKLGVSALLLSALLLGKPKSKSEGLNGFKPVEI